MGASFGSFVGENVRLLLLELQTKNTYFVAWDPGLPLTIQTVDTSRLTECSCKEFERRELSNRTASSRMIASRCVVFVEGFRNGKLPTQSVVCQFGTERWWGWFTWIRRECVLLYTTVEVVAAVVLVAAFRKGSMCQGNGWGFGGWRLSTL